MDTDSTSLIDDHVLVGQSKKAIAALLQYVRKEQQKQDETELLPGKEQHVWLVMTVKRMQPMKNLKPHKIPIAHPLVDPRTTSVCLITKDPQREYKDLLESHNIKFISRVVGVQKLKGKFKGFDARRLLLRENGLFLADERVLPVLPGLLGKKWFEAKKQPIPVSLTKKDLKGELEKAISSTYMHQNRGTCTSIKIANISHKDSQVLANLKTAIPAVVARIHGGWDNVQSFNIKTSSSVSLPIWTCPLGSDEPGSRWAGMGVEEGEWGGIGDAGSEDEAVAVEVEATPKKNGKKRAADADAERELVDAGTKKKAKKSKPSELSTPASSAPIAEPTAQPAKEPSSKKSKKRAVAEDTPSASIAVSSVPSNTPTDKPAKEPSSQKSKKRAVAEDSPSASIAVSPVPSKIPVDKPATSKKQPSEQMLTRDELKKKKKDTLGDAKLEKRKGKLRETEKSTRKGVKAQLVGRIKA